MTRASANGPAAKIGAGATKGATVISELDVIVIHIRGEQAAEYERLFAERELPRWRECKERGAFISARIFRAAFGTDPRQDSPRYVIGRRGRPATPSTARHDADPGFRSSTGSPTHSEPEAPLVYGGRCCTLSDSRVAPGEPHAPRPRRLI